MFHNVVLDGSVRSYLVTHACLLVSCFRGNAIKGGLPLSDFIRVQELCESRGGCPGLSVLTSLTVYVDVKQH